MRNLSEWRPIREVSGPSEKWGVGAADDSRAVIIQPTTKLDAQDAQLICNTHNAALKEGALLLDSLVASRTGEPRFNLTLKSESIQFSLREMKNLQDEISRVMEAGITDAFIARWLRTRVAPGLADDEKMKAMVAGMLSDFREYRDELNGSVEEASADAPAS